MNERCWNDLSPEEQEAIRKRFRDRIMNGPMRPRPVYLPEPVVPTTAELAADDARVELDEEPQWWTP